MQFGRRRSSWRLHHKGFRDEHQQKESNNSGQYLVCSREKSIFESTHVETSLIIGLMHYSIVKQHSRFLLSKVTLTMVILQRMVIIQKLNN